MGCFSPDQPKNLNYGKILDETLRTQIGLEPLLQEANAEWSPFQTNQTLANLNNLLFGSEGGSFDVQTFRPAIFQGGNSLSYGGTPKGFTGDVINPTLGTAKNPAPGSGILPRGGTSPAAGMTFDASTGAPILATARPTRTGSDVGNDAMLGAAAGSVVGPLGTAAGALIGSGIGSMMETGNPDPISAALGINFFVDDKTRLAKSSYGTRTVTQGAQPGLIEMMNAAAKATQAGTIDRLATLGPDARAAILAANPDMAALLDKLNQQAGEGLDAGSGLTPDEERVMQQQARAGWAARGLDGSPGAAADEILRQFSLGQNLKGQRQQFAQSLLGQEQSMLENPIFALLTGSSNALPQAQSLMPGQLFNPESPFAGNIANANQQMAALFADPSTLSKINQTTQTVGNIFSTVGSIAGGVAGI